MYSQNFSFLLFLKKGNNSMKQLKGKFLVTFSSCILPLTTYSALFIWDAMGYGTKQGFFFRVKVES